MTDDTDTPSVDQTFDRMLSDLHVARNTLWKAASPTRWNWPSLGLPLTPKQNQAVAVTSAAIDDANAAIDRATAALLEAQRADDPPKP